MDAAYEWLELYNRTSQTHVINGWRIADNHSDDLISGLQLEPSEFAVIAAGAGFYDSFPNYDRQIVFIDDGRIGNGLNNSGDSLRLMDSTGSVIDALSYGNDASELLPPCFDVREGHTLERRPAGLDTNTAGDFVDNETPSPGYGLAVATPTPHLSPAPTQTLSPSITPVLTPTQISTEPAEHAGTPADLKTPAAAGSSTPSPTSSLTRPLYQDLTTTPAPTSSSPESGKNTWLYIVGSILFLEVAIALLLPLRLSKPS